MGMGVNDYMCFMVLVHFSPTDAHLEHGRPQNHRDKHDSECSCEVTLSACSLGSMEGAVCVWVTIVPNQGWAFKV